MIKIIMHFTKLVITIISSLLLFSCGFSNNLNMVSGSGNVVTENREISSDFKSVSAASGLEVVLVQDSSNSVIVEADDNLQQHIITEVESGNLKIKTDKNIRNAARKKVTVHFKSINSVKSSSGSSVVSNNTLKADTLTLDSSSGSSMKIIAEATKLVCESSSGSDLKVLGQANILETKSSSGSMLNAGDVTARFVESKSSSGSLTTVKPIEKLTAKASSGSSIKYINTPKSISKEASSGGDISQK
ncbi:head GIN domain-containing protein [Flavobacterium sp. MK4S-17]|uniref:head GIN domain-containing protein n=1 Tax=Flavobacterium sp. MK4S-17 TaxID=2543737 RepID=UPI0013570FE9|nr:head GIN domain-containing protein [Flavobacterium sp. MK4S-17]